MTAADRTEPAQGARAYRLLLGLALASLALGCAAGLEQVAGALGLHVPLDPNEGWNAYHSVSAMAGRTPYPPSASLMTNNYPPLSFYVVGALGQLLGDNIVAGRILSLISFLFVGGAIAALARRFSCTRQEASFGAFLFAGFLLLFSDYVGMDDPQLFGHALQLAGLLFLTARRPRLLPAAALFVATLFIKHNLIVLPIAAAAWLFADSRTRALRLAFFMLAIGIVGLIAFRFVLGFDFLPRLASPRTWSLTLLLQNLAGWLPQAALALLLTLGAAARWRNDKGLRFAALYALTATAVGIVFLGGAGVDANAMFDADIAIALGAALALNRLACSGFERVAAPVAVALLAPFVAGLAASYDPDWSTAEFWLHPMQSDASEVERDIAFLRAQPGPAVCESLSLCYWAGKPETVDVFNLSQRFATRERNETVLTKQLALRTFGAVEIDSLETFPFSPAVKSFLLANYRIDHQDDEGVFLTAR